MELTVAALLLGFDAVALNLPAAGGLLHPAGDSVSDMPFIWFFCYVGFSVFKTIPKVM